MTLSLTLLFSKCTMPKPDTFKFEVKRTRASDREGSMTTPDNATSVQRGYDAFRAGDFSAFVDLIADDCVWHLPGRNPIAGTYRGRDAVLSLFAKTIELTDGDLEVELHDVTMSGDHVVALQHTVAHRLGRTLDVRIAIVMHLREGKMVEAWEHFDDQYAEDEFWSD